ncbi:hypothetical protein G9A89_012990 [Geosiphon pyriformis]|nr:hypothetical protein G9A89_012990 [Geosiphon pyriformis]
MITTRAKSKKAAPDICSEISNKISTRGVLSVVETTRQNVLEVFPLSSNCDKLPLVVTEATFSFLAGFSPVKVLLKRHTWISPSVVSTLIIDHSEKWGQSLAFAIVTPNLFVVFNKILNEISIASFGMLFKMGLDQPLAVLPNVVSSSRLLLVLKAKQSSPVGSPVLENWTDQIETESSFSLVSGATSSGAWEIITSHQKFADAVFLVELTSSVYLATLKIVKSLMISESGSPSAVVVLYDVPLGVFAANIKTALSVFGMVIYVVLKSASIWQYVVVHFKKLDSAMLALNHWSVLVGRDSVRIFLLVNQNKTILSYDKFKAKLVNLPPGCTVFEISNMIFQALKMFKPCFVGFLSYAKAFALPVMSEFFLLVASAPPVAVVDPAVGSRLNSLEKQISDLAALVKSIVEPIGSLIVLVSCLLNDNAFKTVQLEKNFFSMKYASNNFANLLVGVFKDIACLRFEINFGGMNYDDIQTAKPSFLSENTVEHVIAL